MEPEKLWTLNKKILDPIVPRYMAVGENSVVLTLMGQTTSENKTYVLFLVFFFFLSCMAVRENSVVLTLIGRTKSENVHVCVCLMCAFFSGFSCIFCCVSL
jgi:hypothetical protein